MYKAKQRQQNLGEKAETKGVKASCAPLDTPMASEDDVPKRQILVLGMADSGKDKICKLLNCKSDKEQSQPARPSCPKGAKVKENPGKPDFKIHSCSDWKVVEVPQLDKAFSGTQPEDLPELVDKWRAQVNNNPDAILMVISLKKDNPKLLKLYDLVQRLWDKDKRSFCSKLLIVFTEGHVSKTNKRQYLNEMEEKAGLKSVEYREGDNATVLRNKIEEKIKNASDKDKVEEKAREETSTNKRSSPADMWDEQSITKKRPADVKHTTTVLVKQPPVEGSKQRNESVDSKAKYDVRQFLIIGKTGTGKSTLCNLLLGESKFSVGKGMSLTTREPQREENMNANVVVIDTPDVTNLDLSTKNRTGATEEIERWQKMVSSDPYAILVTIACDSRYTPEEYKIYEQIKRVWNDAQSFCSRLVVAFTFGDRQDRDIEEELKKVSDEEKAVLKDAGGRWVAFDNSGHEHKKFPDWKNKLREAIQQIEPTKFR